MARARNLKPGFFTNDQLAEIEPLGRLLFAGLWTIADREGRLEDRPRRIKAELLPYDDVDIERLLLALDMHGFIIRYRRGTDAYIQIVNFSKHQNPHVKEADSQIPPPSRHPGGLTDEHTEEHSTSTVQEPDKHSTSRADSLNPITDSPSPIADTKTARPREAAKPPAPKPKPPAKAEVPAFDYIMAMCDATGTDVSELAPAFKSKQGAAAKQLRDLGASPDDAGRCIGWLLSQSWRTGGVDLFTVVKEFPGWLMLGKPGTAQTKTGNGRASPGKLSNYDISAANIDAAGEPDDPFGITGPIYETTGRIRP